MSDCALNNSSIRRYGVIESKRGATAYIRVGRMDACSSCGVADKCQGHKPKDVVVRMTDDRLLSYDVGDSVCVEVTRNVAMRAMLVGIVAPLGVTVFSAIVAMTLGYGDLACVAVAFMALALYYLLIYLLRNRIDKGLMLRLVG